MVPQRTAFGIRVEQPDQPRWLFGINKLWVTAIARWHSLAISGSFPREGPVLLVANHVDAFDPFMVGEAVSRVGKRSITMFARSEFFEVPFLGWWLRRSGAISIRRDEADFGALRAAVEELRRGHVVAAFPQATRAFVPAAVLGTGGSILSRGRFEVRFGEPFVVPPLPPRRTESDLDERARLMEERMLDLLPEAYKRDRVAKARPG